MGGLQGLIGIPHRLVISDRGLEAGTVEYKARGASDAEVVQADQLMVFLTDKLST